MTDTAGETALNARHHRYRGSLNSKHVSQSRNAPDSLVDEHGGEIVEVIADAECVGEFARFGAEHAPALRVERRQPPELTVRLARLVRVQVVACAPS